MHNSVLVWVGHVLTQTDISGRTVLEVGSYDVNGSVRPLVERLQPSSYTGVDQTPGPGVDVVLDAEGLVEQFGPDSFDVVICTETLEHVLDWQRCISQMLGVLRPGGLWLATTRSPGFPYHPYPIDTWRYTRDAAEQLLKAARLDGEVTDDPQAPGVFIRATKPDPWIWDGDLSSVPVVPTR